jgi:hypothetical protein
MRVLEAAETSWVSGGDSVTVTPYINNQSYAPLIIDKLTVADAMEGTGQLSHNDAITAADEFVNDLLYVSYYTAAMSTPTATPNGTKVSGQNTDNDGDGFDETAFYFKDTGGVWMFIDTNNDGLYDQRSLIGTWN